MKLLYLYQSCKDGKQCFIFVCFWHLLFRLKYHLNLIVGKKVKFEGLRNISIKGRMTVAMEHSILNYPDVWSMLYIRGKMLINGMCSIHRGCKIEVADGAILELNNCFINSGTMILCQHGIRVGSNSAIGWNCQLADEDYHDIVYANTPPVEKCAEFAHSINIGKHVLVGNNCYIYKGVSIADGCVVASNSVVKKSLLEQNTLYAGNPAVAIKQIINWTN